MDLFLNEYMDTLSNKARARVSDLLLEARVEKTQLKTIMEKLSTRSEMPALVLSLVTAIRPINASPMQVMWRDVNQAMTGIYGASNLISQLESAHADLFMSEIKKLEDEMIIIEKAIDNYGFLLADARTYDAAFMEPFDNNINRSMTNVVLPDRASQEFSVEQQAVVNSAAGVLSINQTLNTSNPYNASVIYHNHEGIIESDTGIANINNTQSTTGWRRNINASAPITSTLPAFRGLYGEESYKGAQVVVELSLDDSQMVDTIKLNPLADVSFELTQVNVYDSDDTDADLYRSVLDAPIVVEGEISVFFPIQSVRKIELFLRQPLYLRRTIDQSTSEADYRYLSQSYLKSLSGGRSLTSDDLARMGAILRDIFEASNSKPVKITNPKPGTDTDPNIQNVAELLFKLRRYNKTVFLQSPDETGVKIMDLINRYAIRDDANIFGDVPRTNRQLFDTNNQVTQVSTITDTHQENVMPSPTYNDLSVGKYEGAVSYSYIIGLRSVSIGASGRGDKAVFVSSVIPTAGDVGQVKIRSDHRNYLLTDTDSDSAYITSVEYSVSNKANPILEADWIPILPADSASEVVGERFFIDTAGKGFFRFPALAEGEVNLYKNGHFIDLESLDSFIYDPRGEKILGLRVPYGSVTSQDYLTCDYVPALDASVVDYSKSGFIDVPLASFHDADGNGELFHNTNGTLSLKLRKQPYIDYSQVNSSHYNEDVGLLPYQPVTIVASDGNTVVNLTNYLDSGEQSPLTPGATEYQFIHTADTLMFNKPLNTQFRVNYQYLSGNLRFRTVLRSNSSEFVSPQVNFVQLKAKTRAPDAKRK